MVIPITYVFFYLISNLVIDRALPGDTRCVQMFSFLCSFLEKIGQNNGLAPPTFMVGALSPGKPGSDT